MNSYYTWVTVSLCLLIILTRSLPFLLAGFMTERFNRLGKQLPAYIMLLLVIYEIDLGTIFHPPYALPAVLALFIVLLVHLMLKNTLISIICGTVTFILLNLYILPGSV